MWGRTHSSVPCSRCSCGDSRLGCPAQPKASGREQAQIRINHVIPTGAGAPATAEWRDLELKYDQPFASRRPLKRVHSK